MFYIGTIVTSTDHGSHVYSVESFVETDNSRVILSSMEIPGMSTSAPLSTLRRYF